MKRNVFNKIKNLFGEIWRDFRSNGPEHSTGSTCCGHDLPFDTSYLRPQPVRMKKLDNNINNFK